jgi:adenosylhomocysteine nucleosidase
MGAMEEEIAGIRYLIENPKDTVVASRVFTSGSILGHPVVLVFSRWGKVAAASTAASLIHHFGVDELLFTGVAGALDDDLKIGDVVLGLRFFQHDMDASPFLEPFEIPHLRKKYFESGRDPLQRASLAIDKVLKSNRLNEIFSSQNLEDMGLGSPKWTLGDIASGDRFVHGHEEKERLQKNLEGIKCVEMEGAAVAQVCSEHQIPFAVIRIISDEANHNSPLDFQKFISEVAAPYSRELVRSYFEHSDHNAAQGPAGFQSTDTQI